MNVAFFDLGSNSVRLGIINLKPDGSSESICRMKRMVRLGEGAFSGSGLQQTPMQRTINAVRELVAICIEHQTAAYTAIATAAVREAPNGQDFVKLIREKTGIFFQSISGLREAELICKGVHASIPQDDAIRICMDIGGGSTELAVFSGQTILALESLNMGAVRLADRFIKGDTGPVSAERYEAMKNWIREEAGEKLQRLSKYAPTELIGTSGTIKCLGRLNRSEDKHSKHELYYFSLLKIVRELCQRNEEERDRLPGMNPLRTGIIIPGSAIVSTVMEELRMNTLKISGRGLIDGLLQDFLDRHFLRFV